jgi:hypothetical protein
LLSVIEILEAAMEFFMIWYATRKNKIEIANPDDEKIIEKQLTVNPE